MTGSSTPTENPKRPLAGVRVLDMAHVLAGPSCSWLLGMMGADIIKVEKPHDGDLLRGVDSDPQRRAARMGHGFQSVNAGKRSIAVDFKSPEGRKVVLSLADRADVLVQSFRAGALDDIGLGADDLMERNPRLVYCAISGFGQDGPRRGVRAFDHVIQAASGIMALTGEPEGGPQKVGTPVSDTSTGLMAAFAVMAALYERQRTGKGRFVDVSMLHTMFTLMVPQVVQSLLEDTPPPRIGNSAFTMSPTADCFRCQDADILIGANTDEQFRKLMGAVGLDRLIDDPRFADFESRQENKRALRTELEIVLARESAQSWEDVFSAAAVPASVVRDLHEALHHTQFVEDPVTTDMDVPASGQVPLPNLPFKIDRLRPAPAAPPPLVGQHTRDILAEIGYASSAVDTLVAQGIVSAPTDDSARARS